MILLPEGHEVISNLYCQMLPSLNKAYSFIHATFISLKRFYSISAGPYFTSWRVLLYGSASRVEQTQLEVNDGLFACNTHIMT